MSDANKNPNAESTLRRASEFMGGVFIDEFGSSWKYHAIAPNQWIPFTATKDSVCPVGDVNVLIELGSGIIYLEGAKEVNWDTGMPIEGEVTAYMVITPPIW